MKRSAGRIWSIRRTKRLAGPSCGIIRRMRTSACLCGMIRRLCALVWRSSEQTAHPAWLFPQNILDLNLNIKFNSTYWEKHSVKTVSMLEFRNRADDVLKQVGKGQVFVLT